MSTGRARRFLVAVLVACSGASVLAQAPSAPFRIEPIPDPVKIPLSEVAYVHPLWRALDSPARIVDRPPLTDLQTRTTLFTTVRVDENGRPGEGYAIQPPLTPFGAAVTALIPKWRFTPGKRGGAPVVTWATVGLELQVSLEEGTYGAFSLLPVAKDQPLEAIVRELPGEQWMSRYPRDISPKDPAAFSVEDVDILPSPEKASWSFSSGRSRSRVTALVEVSAVGAVKRVVPTGTLEPLVLSWLRQNAATWKLSPAQAGGKAVDSWMTLDATMEYTIDSAKERGRRTIKKNLRGAPPA